MQHARRAAEGGRNGIGHRGRHPHGARHPRYKHLAHHHPDHGPSIHHLQHRPIQLTYLRVTFRHPGILGLEHSHGELRVQHYIRLAMSNAVRVSKLVPLPMLTARHCPRKRPLVTQPSPLSPARSSHGNARWPIAQPRPLQPGDNSVGHGAGAGVGAAVGGVGAVGTTGTVGTAASFRAASAWARCSDPVSN